MKRKKTISSFIPHLTENKSPHSMFDEKNKQKKQIEK